MLSFLLFPENVVYINVFVITYHFVPFSPSHFRYLQAPPFSPSERERERERGEGEGEGESESTQRLPLLSRLPAAPRVARSSKDRFSAGSARSKAPARRKPSRSCERLAASRSFVSNYFRFTIWMPLIIATVPLIYTSRIRTSRIFSAISRDSKTRRESDHVVATAAILQLCRLLLRAISSVSLLSRS